MRSLVPQRGTFWFKYVEMVETLQQFHFAINAINLSPKLQS